MVWIHMEGGPEPASMADAVEGGAALAWRLLATLEGGSLLLGSAALLVYTARGRPSRPRRPVRTVLVTNTSNELGRELKRRLESHGCTVSSLSSGAEAGAEVTAEATADKVDALVVVGAERRGSGLSDIAGMVSEDVYENLKILDKLSSRVHRNGYMSWAMAGATSGAFGEAADAFDAALKASLEHSAHTAECEAVWVGRCETAAMAAERVVAALMTCTTHQEARFSIRNAAYKVTGYVGRWLKIIT
ncbi:hypothetical protein O0L34_g10010 [Tuta absoluta]|nr:hypothetical protein O0L34_g10010 [Tuta absoluta]